jgi:hypothetical protein
MRPPVEAALLFDAENVACMWEDFISEIVGIVSLIHSPNDFTKPIDPGITQNLHYSFSSFKLDEEEQKVAEDYPGPYEPEKPVYSHN